MVDEWLHVAQHVKLLLAVSSPGLPNFEGVDLSESAICSADLLTQQLQTHACVNDTKRLWVEEWFQVSSPEIIEKWEQPQ